MRCGWCDNPAEAEYVNNGVGMQQVTPAQCGTCGATEGQLSDLERNGEPEELARGWFRGEFTDCYTVRLPDEALWLTRDALMVRWGGKHPALADSRAYGTRVHAANNLSGDPLIHACHVGIPWSSGDSDYVFAAHCGQSFRFSTTPSGEPVTCLRCFDLTQR